MVVARYPVPTISNRFEKPVATPLIMLKAKDLKGHFRTMEELGEYSNPTQGRGAGCLLHHAEFQRLRLRKNNHLDAEPGQHNNLGVVSV